MGPAGIITDEVPEQVSLQDLDALRSVLDAIPQPIFIKDDQLRFVAMNRAMCELMGQPHERRQPEPDPGSELRLRRAEPVRVGSEMFRDELLSAFDQLLRHANARHA